MAQGGRLEKGFLSEILVGWIQGQFQSSTQLFLRRFNAAELASVLPG